MDSKQVAITPMTPEDIPAVSRMERENHLEPWSENAFARELTLPHSSILAARVRLPQRPDGGGSHSGHQGLSGMAQEDGASILVGYICAWLVADELQVHNIRVSAPFRSKGIGRMLLEHVLREAFHRNAKLAVLEVRKSNCSALRLYSKMGFVVVGERPDYYTTRPESAVLMEKKLP